MMRRDKANARIELVVFIIMAVLILLALVT
jgi:hypothetical protein